MTIIRKGRFMIRDRRRSSLWGRAVRATWPVRQSLSEIDLGRVPCLFLGHHDVEIPRSLRRGNRMRFKCSRCSTMAGFTN